MIWPGGSPYQQLQAVLSGAASYSDADDAIKSLIRKPVFDMAVAICKENDREVRKKMLTGAPESLRSMVEMEVMRLWPDRHKQLK